MLARFIITALFIFTQVACATSQQVNVTDPNGLRGVRQVTVVSLPDSSDKVSSIVEDALRQRAMNVNERVNADVTIAAPTDAFVTYLVEWGWDMTAYLKTIQINVTDSASGRILGRVTWRDSAMHGFRSAEKTIRGLVANLFADMSQEGVNRSKSHDAIKITVPSASSLLSAFDQTVRNDVDSSHRFWATRSGSPYGSQTAGDDQPRQDSSVAISLRPNPQSSAKQPQSNRGFERSYCVHPTYVKNDSPWKNAIHVTFNNNCPIAVKIEWCEQHPDGSCRGGKGSGDVAAGTTFQDVFIDKEAVRVRYIACSANARGAYSPAHDLSGWYCSPGE